MANCSMYMELSDVEKAIFEAELLHVARSSNFRFQASKILIENGYKEGAFEGVKIMPTPEEMLKGEPTLEDNWTNAIKSEIIN